MIAELLLTMFFFFWCLCVYVQVLTREQARQMSAPKDEKHARALYDFDGQAKKELSFNRVSVR